MPKVTSETEPTNPLPSDRSADAIELMAQILKEQQDNAPRRKLTYAEYIAKHPLRTMPFPVWQNGYPIFASQLPQAGIDLLPKLQEGRFFDRFIHVWRDQTPDRAWHIDYPSKAMGDRMKLTTYGKDIVEILQRLTTETPDLT